MYVCSVPGFEGVGSPAAWMDCVKFEEVIGNVEYLMSYEAAAPLFGKSDGASHERSNDVVCIFEEERFDIVFGA